MLKQIIALLLLVGTCNTVFGLYFHIAETERKCFIEEVPDETTVIGTYGKLHTYDTGQHNFSISLFL